MSIRCIALDLDRTTLSSAGHLSERNRKVIEQAIESGIQIAVASGRSLDSLPAAVLEIPGIRYAVTSNGAAVYDLKERTCLRQYKLRTEAVRDILRWTEALCGESLRGGPGPVWGHAPVDSIHTGDPGTGGEHAAFYSET